MANCYKCNAEVAEDAKFCPVCGANLTEKVDPAQEEAAATSSKPNFTEKVANLNNTEDKTGEMDEKDIADNKVMAVLSYLGLLVLIPIFAAKNSPFARFHANQGLVLCIFMVAYGIVTAILNAILIAISYRLYFIGTILSLLYIGFGILAIIGIVNAAQGKAKALPIIGKIKILK